MTDTDDATNRKEVVSNARRRLFEGVGRYLSWRNRSASQAAIVTKEIVRRKAPSDRLDGPTAKVALDVPQIVPSCEYSMYEPGDVAAAMAGGSKRPRSR